jgi:hypothetical protein
MDLRRRVTGILTDPRREWAVIAAEPADVASVFTSYVLILAAIPAAGLLIGMAWFGPVTAISAAIGSYVTSIVSTLVAALIIERLAPRFSSSGDTVQALKLVAYASTPAWLAGAFYVLLFLGLPLFVLAAIYSIYLFYVGVPIVLKTPLEKVVPFMVVAAITIVVVNIVLQLVLQALGL